jgi:hypothetical protein
MLPSSKVPSSATFLGAAENVSEFADFIAGGNQVSAAQEMQQQQSSVRPRRIVFLALIIVVLAAIVYTLHTLCSFLLEMSKNENFVNEVAQIIKCRRSGENDTVTLAADADC